MPSFKTATLTKPYRPYLCDEAIAFLEPLVEGARVPEYGGGMSTPWLAQRASYVYTVEHDPEWASWICKECLSAGNVLVILQTDLDRYPSEVEQWGPLDVIIVDGQSDSRINCVKGAIDYVAPGGWLVLDDSNWARLRPAVLSVPSDLEATVIRGEKLSRDGRKVISTETTFWRRPCE